MAPRVQRGKTEEITRRADARPVCTAVGQQDHYNAGKLYTAALLKAAGRRSSYESVALDLKASLQCRASDAGALTRKMV